jgi:hypothetical protein
MKGWLALVAVAGALCLWLLVTVLTAQEGDPLGNCHIYGDGRCGDTAPWHGFVGSEG